MTATATNEDALLLESFERNTRIVNDRLDFLERQNEDLRFGVHLFRKKCEEKDDTIKRLQQKLADERATLDQSTQIVERLRGQVITEREEVEACHKQLEQVEQIAKGIYELEKENLPCPWCSGWLDKEHQHEKDCVLTDFLLTL